MSNVIHIDPHIDPIINPILIALVVLIFVFLILAVAYTVIRMAVRDALRDVAEENRRHEAKRLQRLQVQKDAAAWTTFRRDQEERNVSKTLPALEPDNGPYDLQLRPIGPEQI